MSFDIYLARYGKTHTGKPCEVSSHLLASETINELVFDELQGAGYITTLWIYEDVDEQEDAYCREGLDMSKFNEAIQYVQNKIAVLQAIYEKDKGFKVDEDHYNHIAWQRILGILEYKRALVAVDSGTDIVTFC